MIVIVGAGLSGLVCALELARAGAPFVLMEKNARVGGRLGSIYEDGYTFDLGFQVLLDNYPAVRAYLDIDALSPRYFEPGALMWDAGRTFTFRRPRMWTDFRSALQTAVDPGLSWGDKLRLGVIAAGLLARNDEGILDEADAVSTKTYLEGFSDAALERFFRPFFGGVLLDNELETSATLFRYYFKKFLTGRTLVPRFGLQAIPDQLVGHLPGGALRLESEVTAVAFEGGKATAVRLASGEEIKLDHLVLACPEPVTAKLIGARVREAHPAAVIYFRAEQSIYPEKLLVLQAGRRKLVRNLVQITNISPDYAPPGAHLISATVLRARVPPSDVAAAEQEINHIFKLKPGTLSHVRTVEIPYAVPAQAPGNVFTQKFAKPFPNVWRCGDQVSHASFQGAMESGAVTAGTILHDA
jgi:phytoene dehydrogenase-like protein